MEEEVNSEESNIENIEMDMDPLELDIIIHKILDYIPTTKLAKVRPVCKYWNSITTKILRNRRDYFVNLSCANVQCYVATMTNCEVIPFTCYRFACLSLGERVIGPLLKLMKDNVKCIRLDMTYSGPSPCILRFDDQYQAPLNFINFLYNVSSSLEEIDFDEIPLPMITPADGRIMKNVKVKTSESWVAGAMRKLTLPAQNDKFDEGLWTLFLQLFPNLVDISINNANQTEPIFNALQTLGKLANLKKLRLENLTPEILQSLISSPIILEEFKVNILSKKISTKKLESLLKKFANNLRVLAFGSPENNGKILLKLPKMPNLKNLGLFHIDDSLIVLEGLKFASDLPALQILSISSSYQQLDWKEYFSYDEKALPCTSLRSLTVGFLVSDPECAVFLGKIFPNIEKLDLEFPKPEFLQKIWSNWPTTIKDLYFYFHQSSTHRDISLCGFPKQWYSDTKKRLKKTSRDVHKKIEGMCPPPETMGIANFKALQRLVIEETPPTNSEKASGKILFSDLCIYFALAYLSDLRFLKIGRSQISPAAVIYLKSTLPNLEILDIRENDGPGIFCEEEKEELISYIDYYNQLGNSSDSD